MFKLLKSVKFGYESLGITPKIHQLNREVYRLTEQFPVSERYGIASQIRRAVVSVLLNLAEGSSRKSRAEFARFTKISIGSLVETDAGLKLSVTLGFITETDRASLDSLIQELYFKLVALRDSQNVDS